MGPESNSWGVTHPGFFIIRGPEIWFSWEFSLTEILLTSIWQSRQTDGQLYRENITLWHKDVVVRKVNFEFEEKHFRLVSLRTQTTPRLPRLWLQSSKLNCKSVTMCCYLFIMVYATSKYASWSELPRTYITACNSNSELFGYTYYCKLLYLKIWVYTLLLHCIANKCRKSGNISINIIVYTLFSGSRIFVLLCVWAFIKSLDIFIIVATVSLSKQHLYGTPRYTDIAVFNYEHCAHLYKGGRVNPR